MKTSTKPGPAPDPPSSPPCATLQSATTAPTATPTSPEPTDKLFDADRLTETTTSVKGTSIDAWYSGKHRTFGANIQAIMRPDGLPIWTSAAMPGHLHDLTCAQHLDITGALY
ncbi:hypothetical protein GCM10010170_021210 [Dactylosporangium salmoneum]|uniref:DDE Tnp4 domain-containing protein n=1 Tax=Dactylosporangium salmoneum TaxID=53361 RepID=A0ABP5SUT9_9ACTN